MSVGLIIWGVLLVSEALSSSRKLASVFNDAGSTFKRWDIQRLESSLFLKKNILTLGPWYQNGQKICKFESQITLAEVIDS